MHLIENDKLEFSKGGSHMKKKSTLLFIVIAVVVIIVLGLVFKDKLIQTYVTVFHKSLEEYSENLLDDSETRSTNYGLWDVDIYHENNMVEFMTGGFGLTPSSTYKGFYYSADNTHKVFSVADTSTTSLEVDGDHATWTDGTDNHGTSLRIMDNWFWFESSF